MLRKRRLVTVGIFEVASAPSPLTEYIMCKGQTQTWEVMIFMSCFFSSDIPQYADVKLKSTDKTVGSLRAVSGYRGIALLRVNDVLKQPSELYTTDSDGNNVDVRTHRPKWWPDGVGVL